MSRRSRQTDENKSHGSHIRPNINVGTIVFFVIFVYILINIINYLGRQQVSAAEVQKGTIVDNTYYTGLILRTEELVTTNSSGLINFYINHGDKAAKGSAVYLLSSDASVLTDTDLDLSDDSELNRLITSYMAAYADSTYSDLYTFADDLQNTVTASLSSTLITELSGDSSSFQTVTAEKSGIICYTYDGFENLSIDDINEDLFSANNADKQQIIANQWLDSGDVAYRLVTDDEWSIILLLSDEDVDTLSEKSSITILLGTQELEATASVEVFSSGGNSYACLTLSKYMIQFISDRYIEITIEGDSAEGLKIPTSSIVTKDFYVIPLDYLVTDEETSEEGFYKYIYDADGELKAVFYDSTIYAQDDDYCYVSSEEFSEGDVIGKVNSSDRYTIGATKSLTGVYNINQGYAIFRIIEILYQNDTYCIVEDSTSYGISLYDHIALNGSAIEEGEIIY